MGKPHHYTVDYLTHNLGCESQELCFIGDRLETDILIRQKHDIPSVLVLTGVTDEKTYRESPIRASVVEDSLKTLAAHL